eukprot:GHVR01143753.1.p2 GENE.GHVR01143753.1~~GHVR01143753.1.p2  ORF type:complete len:125 (+),score=28.35 GHVR01143753.1:39-413(+)
MSGVGDRLDMVSVYTDMSAFDKLYRDTVKVDVNDFLEDLKMVSWQEIAVSGSSGAAPEYDEHFYLPDRNEKTADLPQTVPCRKCKSDASAASPAMTSVGWFTCNTCGHCFRTRTFFFFFFFFFF